MTTADPTHQCPQCELRFAYRTELADHLRVDHPQPFDDDTPRLRAAPVETPEHALVVFESMFGNTRAVAEEIAAGLADGATVELVEVGRAPTRLPDDLDLLVVGGPTHAFGLSRPGTREQAASESKHRVVSRELGLREWLDGLAGHAYRARVATFDTRIRHVPGSAARAAARRLRRLGLPIATPPASFYVAGKYGPLANGERERARHWGARLVAPRPARLVR